MVKLSNHITTEYSVAANNKISADYYWARGAVDKNLQQIIILILIIKLLVIYNRGMKAGDQWKTPD